MWRPILDKPTRKKGVRWSSQQSSAVALKGVNLEEIEIELTSLYAGEALQISVVNKWLMRPARETRVRGWRAIGRPADSDLTHLIPDLIREPSFLSCKMLCKHLSLSKETCLRVLHEKLAINKFHLRYLLDQLTRNRTSQSQELPCEVNFLKYSNIAKQRTLCLS
jgi:hypothetical protein